MTEPTGHEITELLQAWREGDERTLEKLTPEIYRELHNAARRCMGRERDGAFTVALDEAPEVASSSHSDVIVVDDALKALALIDERKSRVVELRFFGGLSVEETAEVLKVSPDTVARDWRLAKAWLLREMGGKSDGS
jgi:RNA polymerase sigma factor (sigma-70 family)